MKRKILIIDDDPGIQDILKIIFDRAGYAAAIEDNVQLILSNNYSLPDIFLLDRYLSGVDGLDICRHLKHSSYSANIPVVMVSASPDIARLAIEAGADGFVEKPFNMADMISTIEQFFDANASVNTSL